MCYILIFGNAASNCKVPNIITFKGQFTLHWQSATNGNRHTCWFFFWPLAFSFFFPQIQMWMNVIRYQISVVQTQSAATLLEVTIAHVGMDSPQQTQVSLTALTTYVQVHSIFRFVFTVYLCYLGFHFCKWSILL